MTYGPGLADRLQQCVQVGGFGREGLRGGWSVARAVAEPFVGAHAGGLRNGGFDLDPAAPVAFEPGDQHHGVRTGTVTVHVESGTVHGDEFVNEGG